MFLSKKAKLVVTEEKGHIRARYRGISLEFIGYIFPMVVNLLADACKQHAKPGVDWKQAFERITEVAKEIALAELIDRDKGLYWALMAYNGGPSYANRMMAADTLSDYACYVITASERIKQH